MDKIEAYEILANLLKEQSEAYKDYAEVREKEFFRTGKKGNLYTILVVLETDEKGKILLKGEIRGNNPQKYEILEETFEVQL